MLPTWLNNLRCTVKLRRLCKSADSFPQGDCSAMYVSDDPATMVGQGKVLDTGTAAELLDVAEDERAVAIPTETVLRAAALLLAENGRPAMTAEVEAFLRESEVIG